jgi:metallo-beta-lactamase family protein
MYWLRSFGHTPRNVFIVHGEEEVEMEFSKLINNELGLNTYIPSLFESVELQ